MQYLGNIKLTLRKRLAVLHSKKQPLGYATAGAVTYMFSSVIEGSFSPFVNTLVFGMLYVMYSAVYIYNDIIDMDIDKINSKDRPLASGSMTPGQAKKMVTSLFIITALLTFLSSYLGSGRDPFNHLTVLATISAAVLLGVMYSHPRIYLKKRFPFKSLSIAAGAGLASLTGWSISGAGFSLAVLLSVFSTSVVIFVMSLLFDLRDLKGDRLHNVRTFPLVLGVQASCKIMCFSLILPVLAAVIIAVLFDERIGPTTTGILAAVSVLGIKALSRLRSNAEDGKTFRDSVVAMRRLYYLTQLGMGSLVIQGISLH